MTETKIIARLFVDGGLKAGNVISPGPGQAHYLLRVMRAGDGARVALFNGDDGEWLAVVEKAAAKSCILRVEKQLRPQRPEPDLWLAFAPLKKSNTDFLVEKATELGVSRLIPVFTERTNSGRVKPERLKKVAMEAAEQCDRLCVPKVSPALSFDAFLADWPAGRILLAPDETGGGRPLKSVLDGLSENTKNQSHAFLIGPEGGFSPSELDALDNLAFVTRVGLGPRILRAETAALAALACYQAVSGDWEHYPRFNDGYIFNAHR